MTDDAYPDPPLVSFVIGGAQKAGTTSLALMLIEHPRMFIALGKETGWFDNDRNFEPGKPPTVPYAKYFGGADADALCFDATPTYLWWPPTPARIRDYNPAMKWVLLLRDPVDRAHSHWNMERARGNEPLPFVDALRAEGTRMASAGASSPISGYFSRGLYAHQLKRLWSVFPREQALVLRSDWLRDDPAGTYAQVLDFVGAEPAGPAEPHSAHAGTYEAPLPPAVRRGLQAMYEPDIRELESMLGWDLSDWLR